MSDLLERTMKSIRDGEIGFDMNTWCADASWSPSDFRGDQLRGRDIGCGTTACIAGHIAIAAGAQPLGADYCTSPDGDVAVDYDGVAVEAWLNAYPQADCGLLEAGFEPSFWVARVGYGRISAGDIEAFLREVNGEKPRA